jgi:histidyl-tRNA synthetase
VLEAIGLGGEDKAGQRLTVLRAIDKLDRLGPDGVRQLLGEGRKDESGDFTRGARLDRDQTTALIDLIAGERRAAFNPGAGIPPRDNPDLAEMKGGVLFPIPQSSPEVMERIASNLSFREGMNQLDEMRMLFEGAGYGSDRITIDQTVVRGLEYYTGPVYEAELTFEVKNDEGQIVRFGSVAGGGRYDGLVGRFRPEPVPATGFSIGVSRLLSALQIVKSPIVTGEDQLGPVVVLVMDRERIADYQRMVADLRSAKIRAELYLGSAGMKAQMKYADRRRAPCVIIQGSNEKAAGEVQIKDLFEGAERARADAAGASNAEYRAARLAQVSVPEQDLVETVRKIIAARNH